MYADKAYIDADWKTALINGHAIELITLQKKQKGNTLVSGDTFSTFVSSVPLRSTLYLASQLRQGGIHAKARIPLYQSGRAVKKGFHPMPALFSQRHP